MPDPAYRSHSAEVNFAGSTSVPEPAGAAQGDVLYCLLYLSGQAAPSPATGWSQLATSGTGPSWTLYRIIRGASAPSLVWSFSNDAFTCVVVAYSDPDQTTPEDATVVFASGSGQTITFGDITTVTNNALHVVLGNQVNAGAFGTWDPVPSGMTTRSTTSGAGSDQFVLADATKATAGATGTKTATTNAVSGNWGGFTIAIRPATAPPSYEQYGFRWRNDDGSETTATWKAAQDTAISLLQGNPARLRVGTNITNDAPAEGVRLQFRKVGDTPYKDVRRSLP